MSGRGGCQDRNALGLFGEEVFGEMRAGQEGRATACVARTLASERAGVVACASETKRRSDHAATEDHADARRDRAGRSHLRGEPAHRAGEDDGERGARPRRRADEAHRRTASGAGGARRGRRRPPWRGGHVEARSGAGAEDHDRSRSVEARHGTDAQVHDDAESPCSAEATRAVHRDAEQTQGGGTGEGQGGGEEA